MRLLSPWDFPGKNTGVGCRALLQGIFPTQGLNLVAYVSCTGSWSGFFTTSATWEILGKKYLWKIKCSINYLECWSGRAIMECERQTT